MEKNIVIYDESGQIVECDFKRVDFNDPTSILNYGLDVQEDIGGILESTSQMSQFSYDISVDDEQIHSLSNFGETLDEGEKKRNSKTFGLIKFGKSILGRLGVNKYENSQEMYSPEWYYQEYCRMIESIVEGEEGLKQSSITNIGLRQAIITDMIPLIDKLEKMLEVGELDKKEFDNITEGLKKQPETLDTQHEIQYRTQVSAIFEEKLHKLRLAITMYKEQVQGYRLQQVTDQQIVMAADSYIRDTAPILKAQGSIMVFNRDQKEKIEFQRRLIEASNQAVVSNAKDLEQNAAGAVELMLTNGITVDTLRVVENALKNGVQIFREGRAKKQNQIEQNRIALNGIQASLDSFQQELIELAGTDESTNNLLGNGTSSNPYVKKIGTKK